jgi:Ribosomal protein L11 methyltransferase (PrmA)
VTANLFSDLLIEILPRLKCDWLILSGILREQESRLIRSLARNRFKVMATLRREKWIAILAKSRLTALSGAAISPDSGDSISPAREAVDHGRRSRLCPNFPTPSSHRIRCANRAPAASWRD